MKIFKIILKILYQKKLIIILMMIKKYIKSNEKNLDFNGKSVNIR